MTFDALSHTISTACAKHKDEAKTIEAYSRDLRQAVAFFGESAIFSRSIHYLSLVGLSIERKKYRWPFHL